ncbi:MAG: DegV family protein [Armatimonadota bacterium]
MELGIITDSASDLSPTAARELSVGLVPLYVQVGPTRFKDWRELDPDALYGQIRQGAHPSTEPPTVEDFLEVYERHLRHFDRLLSIHLSGEISLTVERAREAADKIAPGRIRVFDSRTVSGGVSALVYRATECAAMGWDEEAILGELRRIQREDSIFFSVASLEHLVRGGRLPKIGQAIGDLLGLRPILTVKEGKIKTVRAVRENAVAQVLVKNLLEPLKGRRVRVTVAHADVPAEMLEEIKELINKAGVTLDKGRVIRMGSIVTAHTGLGTLGLHAYPV